MAEALALLTTYYWIPMSLILGYFYAEIRVLRERLECKADKEDLDELKVLIKELTGLVTEIRVDFSGWRGQIEGQKQKH